MPRINFTTRRRVRGCCGDETSLLGAEDFSGVGVEDDPRDYLLERIDIFRKILPKLKPEGIVWCNLGCAAHLFDRAKGLPGSRRKGTGLYIIPPEPLNL